MNLKRRYQRGLPFAKRTARMQDWANYCTKIPSDAKVLSINANAYAA
jgi:hypothetical protein